MRLLLALAVVAAHTQQFGSFSMVGGGDAVRIFFSISGFYMALILNEKYKDTGLFYSNRALRLYPAYLVTLLACIAWFWVVWTYTGKRPPPYWVPEALAAMPIWVRAMLSLSDWTMIGLDVPLMLHWVNQHVVLLPINGGTEPPDGFWMGRILWISHGWSIGMEIWFYILAPFVVRRGWLVQSVLATASILLMWEMTSDRPLATFFFPANLCFFLGGSLLYRFYRSSLFRPVSKPVAWGVLSCVSTTLLLVGYAPNWAAAPLLCCLTLSFPYLFEAFKKSRLDTFVGNLSYPIYLLHMLVIAVMAAVVHNESGIIVAVITTVLAVGMVRYIEEPLDRFRQRRAQARSLAQLF